MGGGSLHTENREWAFESLDALQRFLEDEDFHGNADEERPVIERRRKELREAKYRVVFLGAFNVGKSTLVNALLGDEYLPTVLEECTAKITHVAKADCMGVCVALTAPATDAELRTLEEVLANYGVNAQVARETDSYELALTLDGGTSNDLRMTLNTLITMRAEEDYPQLRTLRAKFDEIFVSVPDALLEEDIALVDSPGVHSISQSNAKLTQDIIPHSHLVVCLIDSQSAGNNQDRAFIETIVKHRLRKVIFVINKADQLNGEEIDPLGHHGPAKDLYRSLQGVVEGPELFFVSSLYALTARRLAGGCCTLDSLDANNKIRIPFGLQRELLAHEAPEQAAAEYLLEQSRFPAFRSRLLDYLYHENREGAVLESVCRFLSDLAWKFLRPVEVQLDMARNVPRLAELNKMREDLNEALDVTGWHRDEIVNGLTGMAEGGDVYGVYHTGYRTLLETRITKNTVEKEILEPLRSWMTTGGNLRKARRNQYRPLREEADRLVNGFMTRVMEQVNGDMDAAERPLLDRLAEVLKSAPCDRPDAVAAQVMHIGPLRAGLASSYFGFLCGGAAMCSSIAAVFAALIEGRAYVEMAIAKTQVYAMQCAARWPQLEQIVNQPFWGDLKDPRIAAPLAGMAFGGLAGLVLRKLSARGARRRRINEAVTTQVNAMLLGAEDRRSADSAKGRVSEAIETRNASLLSGVRSAFETAIADLIERRRVVVEEEEVLRAKQEQTIARLEPKAESLKAVMNTAREIADTHAPK